MNSKLNTRELTITAVLAALTAIISFMPIRLGIEITLSMVPVAVGAVLYGKKCGALLGAVFGVVSFLQCLGYSPFGVAMFTASAVRTAVFCIPTRVLAGYLAGLFYELVSKKNNLIATAVGCIAAPVLNTVLFMSALIILFYNTDALQYYVNLLGAKNPFTFAVLFVGVNGLIEMIAGIIIAFPVAKAVKRYARV